jgi:hypothetical protein
MKFEVEISEAGHIKVFQKLAELDEPRAEPESESLFHARQAVLKEGLLVNELDKRIAELEAERDAAITERDHALRTVELRRKERDALQRRIDAAMRIMSKHTIGDLIYTLTGDTPTRTEWAETRRTWDGIENILTGKE